MIDTKKVLKSLQQMKEDRLTEKLIMPLLDKFSFNWIEFRHGRSERGVDILCCKEDEWGNQDLLGIQVKRIKFSGSTSSKGHLAPLLNQMSQCLSEPVKLKDGNERVVNRIWLISPFELNISALEAYFSGYAKALVSRLSIIDGLKLVSTITDKAPELLLELGDSYTSYLQTLQKELSIIQESTVFKLKSKLSIADIFVHGDVAVIPRIFSSIRSLEPRDHESEVPIADALRFVQYGKEFEEIFGITPVKLISDPTESLAPKARSKAIQKNEIKATLKFEGTNFLNCLTTSVNIREAEITRCFTCAALDLPQELRTFHNFSLSLEKLISNEAVLQLCKTTMEPKKTPQQGKHRFPVLINEILGSGLNIQIVGSAGAGKTTLVKAFGLKQLELEPKKSPVYLPLSSLNSNYTLLESIFAKARSYGLFRQQRDFEKSLSKGELLLLLDGLDEAISRVTDIRAQLIEFIKSWPTTQVIIGTRHWSALDDCSSVTVNLLPFSEEQLRIFFKNWFKDNESHASEIIEHFDKHPSLYKVISSPLLATVFAVIKTMGGNLPSTLVELHEERLRLMLHDWDSIKGVKRCRFSPQDKKFYLRKLAFYLHKNCKRAASFDELVQIVLSHIGDVPDKNAAFTFIDEIVKVNNLLFQDKDGLWSLGHLQFQEYLAAVEAKENPDIDLSLYIDDGWWDLVIQFYAAVSRDISSLLLKSYKFYGDCLSGNIPVLKKLLALVALAPNTSKKIRGILEKEADLIDSINRGFSDERYSSLLQSFQWGNTE